MEKFISNLNTILNNGKCPNQKIILVMDAVLSFSNEFLKDTENKVSENVPGKVVLSNLKENIEDLIAYSDNIEETLSSYNDTIKRLQKQNIDTLERLKSVENKNLQMMEEYLILKQHKKAAE